MIEDNSAGVEMLFLTADGKMKVAHSGRDLNDADRVKRDEGWTKWLERVAADTQADKGRGDGTGGNDLQRLVGSRDFPEPDAPMTGFRDSRNSGHRRARLASNPFPVTYDGISRRCY